MKLREMFLRIHEDSGIPDAVIARRMGAQSTSVYDMKGRDSVTTDLLIRYMNAARYRIVLLPMGVDVPEGGIVLDEESGKVRYGNKKAPRPDAESADD